MVAKSTQSREGVKGQLPLAGCRDSVPAGAWGNAPTVGRLTYSKGKVKHGTLVAGSEASLRTNSRSRRSGIPHPRKKSTMVVCAAKGSRGRPQSPLVASAEAKPSATQKSTCLSKHHCLLPPRRIFPMQKIPRLSHNRRRKLMQTLLEK